MKTFILTEGGGDIGLGHITRCISLCQALKEKGVAPELIVNAKGVVADLLKEWKFHVFDWLSQRKGVFDLIAGADIVICDSFLADISFYNVLSALVKIPVYIDDNNRLEYPRGIVVNVSIYSEEFDYPEKEDIVYLLGSKFAILRKEFWDVPEKRINADIQSIMVTLGGYDWENITPDIMKILIKKHAGFVKKIVVGRGFENKKLIETLKDPKTELIYDPDAGKMKKTMIESDIAISAGGQTLYELARIGIPVIGIAAAENQLRNLQGWQRAGFLEYAGKYDDKVMEENISRALKKLMQQSERLMRSKIGRENVDGKGAERLCDIFLEKHTFGRTDGNLQKKEM